MIIGNDIVDSQWFITLHIGQVRGTLNVQWVVRLRIRKLQSIVVIVIIIIVIAIILIIIIIAIAYNMIIVYE